MAVAGMVARHRRAAGTVVLPVAGTVVAGRVATVRRPRAVGMVVAAVTAHRKAAAKDDRNISLSLAITTDPDPSTDN
jgi:hypothetical protein